MSDFVLDVANDTPRGLWADGTTLWVMGLGADDLFAYYAYDLESREAAP